MCIRDRSWWATTLPSKTDRWETYILHRLKRLTWKLWITLKQLKQTSSISNKCNPSTLSSSKSCISSTIDADILIVTERHVNWSHSNELFAVSIWQISHWGMHGLIIKTSVWLLAGSTRSNILSQWDFASRLATNHEDLYTDSSKKFSCNSDYSVQFLNVHVHTDVARIVRFSNPHIKSCQTSYTTLQLLYLRNHNPSTVKYQQLMSNHLYCI